ncbi:hypothetical protein SAMN02910370_01938 [Lachnospiraceae bacterium XPB1003]|nr:hypothetical protein SAMN02910370_01938 [Lachnospiraceae bacterium XPB1003]
MRLWFRLWKNTRLIKQTVIERSEDDTRTHKINHAIEDACQEFDLGTPIWLEKNIKDFKRSGRVRFTGDSFIEGIEFDYMEMSVLEEDMIF